MARESGELALERVRARERWALVCLTVGLFLGPVGVGAGWVLTFSSRRWTLTQKALAAVAVPVPLVAAAIIVVRAVRNFSMEDQNGSYASPSQVAMAWIGFLGLVVVPALLVAHLERAARADDMHRSSRANAARADGSNR